MCAAISAALMGIFTLNAPGRAAEASEASRAISATGSGVARGDTLRILAIGNSFSEDAVEHNLHEIAAADGITMIIGNMFIGGCNLERHYLNAKKNRSEYSYRKVGADGVRTVRAKTSLAYAFRDEPWDVVTFQQSSPLSGKMESYEPYLPYLINYARQRAPKGARLMLHQTWAFAKNATHSKFANYGRNQSEMYDSLRTAYAAMADKYSLGLIPAGTAMQNARGTYIGDGVVRDGYHLSWWTGRYIAACTWYGTLTGNKLADNAWTPPHIDAERLKVARECADAAVASPQKTTPIQSPDRTGIYNFRLIPEYTLPDPLKMQDGTPVTSPEQWYASRRPELVELFKTEMFGHSPESVDCEYTVDEEPAPALGGKAVRHQVSIKPKGAKHPLHLLVYTPADADGPVPTFLGCNFKGNITISDDPGILEVPESDRRAYGIFPINERGASAARWPIEQIVSRGYGIATFHYSDVDPDFDDGHRNGWEPLIYKEGQNYPEPDQWGSIAQWAWGLSRALDYLETYGKVDASKVIVFGHSRLGKTALWAGVSDPRFAMAISNDSGCGGAALSRRAFGETVYIIQNSFPHWFCGNFRKYGGNEGALPFDQHELLACMAPRPVYVASAEGDGWADPVGERISVQEASKVYNFLGLGAEYLGYHIRQGLHNILLEDWEHYMDFADTHLGK